MALAALIFDVDGTLAETEEVHRQAFNDIFEERKFDWHWSWEQYSELLKVTGGVERITHFLRTEHSGVFSDEWIETQVPDIHRAKTARYGDLLASGSITLRPGIERLCKEARDEGVTLAISTTTSPANVAALIDHSPDTVAMDWFSAVGAGNIVGHKKPAPDIYLWTLEQLGIPASECVAVEDSYNGIASASAAGLATVVTYSSYTKSQDFTGALAVADTLGDTGIPSTLLSGDHLGKGVIDLELIRAWHSAC
jgi:HAD superfamily hydrolase (TIGR01509 family)